MAGSGRSKPQSDRPVRALSAQQDRSRHCTSAGANHPRRGVYGGRMTGMFGGARWRMVGWSILVLSVILFAVSAVLYVSLERTLMSSVDAQLQTASESAR